MNGSQQTEEERKGSRQGRGMRVRQQERRIKKRGGIKGEGREWPKKEQLIYALPTACSCRGCYHANQNMVCCESKGSYDPSKEM